MGHTPVAQKNEAPTPFCLCREREKKNYHKQFSVKQREVFNMNNIPKKTKSQQNNDYCNTCGHENSFTFLDCRCYEDDWGWPEC